VTAEENSSPPEGMLIGMPDPSAVWAEQQGYQYFTRTNPDGSQYGVTILPDGLEYDAWDLFRTSRIF
jgi:putative hemolysin